MHRMTDLVLIGFKGELFMTVWHHIISVWK